MIFKVVSRSGGSNRTGYYGTRTSRERIGHLSSGCYAMHTRLLSKQNSRYLTRMFNKTSNYPQITPVHKTNNINQIVFVVVI